MQEYRHVLFATDLSPRAPAVGRHAQDLAARYGARLSFVHVIEEVNVSAGYELMPLLPEMPDETLTRESQAALARLAAELGLPEAVQTVLTSVSTKAGILDTAAELGVDLIVVGSHGRHGLALLLGSTADAVLHGARCDVLAVRLPD